MGVILTPKRFLSKPQYEVQIDYGNPICRGLIGAFNILNIGARNLVTNNLSTLTGSPTYNPAFGASFNGSSNDIRESYGASKPASYMDNVTCMSVFKAAGTPTTFGAAAGITILTNERGTISVGIDSSGYAAMQFTTSANFYVQAGAAVSLVNKESVVIATRDSAAAPTGVKIFQGGMGKTFDGTTGNGLPVYGNGGTLNYIHGFGANSSYFNGSVKISAVWNRLLSDAELQSLSENPYQIFKAPSRRVWFSTSSGPTYTITAASGSFSLTGNAAALRADRKLAVSAGSFSLAGNSAAVTAQRKLAVAVGTFALTGNNAALTLNRKLVTASGSFAITGSSAGLIESRKVALSSGSFLLTGNDSILTVARKLTAASGSFSLTGNDAGLIAARKLTATSASYALTGSAANLVYTPIGGATYTLVGGVGSFALTGNAAVLKADRAMSAAAGSFDLTGNAAGFVFTRKLAASSGNFTLAGSDILLKASRYLSAGVGAYSLIGNPVTLSASSAILYSGSPSGSGYTPKRDERQSRSASGNQTRLAATQRNSR